MPFHLGRRLFVVIAVLLIEFAVYFILIKPVITVWGASETEVRSSMAGDRDQARIASTRAIHIQAPNTTVWKWLMQLGADRHGFYSYGFIERALGYHSQFPDMAAPQFEDFNVGDLVRGSVDGDRSVIAYNFPVLYIEPEKTVVLGNWGSFLLKPVGNNETRLIIRTQEDKSSALSAAFKFQLAIPFHFIMERRMMLGIKAQAEHDQAAYSPLQDTFWVLGIALSGCVIFLLALIGRNLSLCITMTASLGVLWLAVVFLLNPVPLYSMTLLAVVSIVFAGVLRAGRYASQREPANDSHTETA